MKPSSFIFILFVTGSVISSSISIIDKCSGRWQTIDQLNIKLTLDWQTDPKTNLTVIEFRTNVVTKGFWYGFGISSSLNETEIGLVYALRWRGNDTERFWDTYNVNKSNVTVLKQDDTSLITFQPSLLSGLLTVRITSDLTTLITEQQCLYFVYMRGRFSNDIPLLPDETIFNRSLCPTCTEYELTSTSLPSTIEYVTTNFINIENSTIQLVDESTSDALRQTNEGPTTATPFPLLPFNFKNEVKFFWFGRITNQLWTTDYDNLSSPSSVTLRLKLQNLFLFLIKHNTSFPFICKHFVLYSLQSGSILFASNITLISSLSENQTINIIEKLINNVNKVEEYKFNFDILAHHIIRANEPLQINSLFQYYSARMHFDNKKQEQLDATIRLLFACVVSIGCLIILTTTILCLYGYYKCRRRQLRLINERQKLKFKQDTNSYTWLGQQPSAGSSSPYLIQSTTI